MKSQLFPAVHRHPCITNGYGITDRDWNDSQSVSHQVSDCNVVYAGLPTFRLLMHPLKIKEVEEAPRGQPLFQCLASVLYGGHCAWKEIVAQNVAVYMRLLKLDCGHPLFGEFLARLIREGKVSG